MNLKDGDEKNEAGLAKDKIISLCLKSLVEEELTDRCFVHLEIAVYSWINSVPQAQPALVIRKD
jgi:hypothetical protein